MNPNPSCMNVLLVEDEALVAMMLVDMLETFGHQVIGPAPSVTKALDLMKDRTINLAILDVNLAGEAVFPVADRLAEAGVPFVFSTGYGRAGLREPHIHRPVLQKPYTADQLKTAIDAATSEVSGPDR